MQNTTKEDLHVRQLYDVIRLCNVIQSYRIFYNLNYRILYSHNIDAQAMSWCPNWPQIEISALPALTRDGYVAGVDSSVNMPASKMGKLDQVGWSIFNHWFLYRPIHEML